MFLSVACLELKRVCGSLRVTASCRNQTKLGCVTDLTVKQQSSERKHPSSPTPKKAITVLEKEMALTFSPNYDPEDNSQQAQLGDFTHYHPSEIIHYQ
ncbi:hypothetical protein TNCV_4958921 [Trichonephila clavipes]|uniref:Uncharacterized protein n=1 Tax=Trichonephila clavipes TaxID=2585209 RepID=A0A8X6VCP8_TRICX|nr:hypothetical protein TNCV_4958921 [Trichonephila clavipes]